MKRLNANAFSKNTQKSYKAIIKKYINFGLLHGLSTNMPFSTSDVSKYIAYLYCSKYAFSTVLTHLAAISFVHKFKGLNDPTKDFQVQHLLKGYKSFQETKIKLPLSIKDLSILVSKIPILFHDNYSQVLFSAMLIFGFFFRA